MNTGTATALRISLLVVISVMTASCNPRGTSITDGAGTPVGGEAIDWESRIVYQRGIEAVGWATPAVSMINYREAHFGLGGGLNTVYYLSTPATPMVEVLTPNNQTPYASVFMNTKNGPMVLVVPPASAQMAIFGSAVDIWQVPVADIGPAGTDEGRGGRYLFLPPGYAEEVPEGYFVVPMETYNVLVTLRLIPLGGATFSETAVHARDLNAYPLSQADNPPAGKYIDFRDRHLPTLPTYDLSFFTDILTVLNEEPLLERDMVMGGMLASIGIERGKPFQPGDKVRGALEQAVADAWDYLEFLFETPGYAFELFWPDRQWMDVRQPSADGFVFDEGEYLLLDDRAAIFHFAAFAPRRLGKATAYLMVSRDADGADLSGQASYRLRVPGDVPARDFWSVIAYSRKTKAFIYNDLDRVGLSSFDTADMQVHDDGSVDIYFGETAPDGLEGNWIPTEGEDFFLLFRFYGPEQAYFDRTFKLNDLEKL